MSLLGSRLHHETDPWPLSSGDKSRDLDDGMSQEDMARKRQLTTLQLILHDSS